MSTSLFIASCDNSSSTSDVSKDSTTTMSSDAATSMNTDTALHTGTLHPTGPKPSWAPDITPAMQTVIEKLTSYGDSPIVKLSAPEARKNHSPADAVKDLMQEYNISAPENMSDTSGKDIDVAGGKIHLRIYTPKQGNGPFPVIVYYHGGGWVIANLDTYDASARSLADQTGAVLVSVAYRQAPEFKFPTAHNDSYAAYDWVVKNAASIKGDPKRIAVAGESAGGNLACAMGIMAREKGQQLPIYQVLVYPIAGYDFTTPSYKKDDNTKPLNTSLMKWFFEKYLRTTADGNNPLISLVKANLKGLPPATVITDELDPLMSEGAMLADKLKAAGVTVNYKNYDGVTHEFFGMASVVPEAKDAQSVAIADLKTAFSR
ncbi:MAG: alpha/beta hydrolase [Ginsengibacter sp.]